MTSPESSPTQQDAADRRDRIQISGDVVRRPAHRWTPTVHAFLRHLRAAGLECVPEPLAIERETDNREEGAGGGTETLHYLPGASGRDGWFAQHPTEGLESAARGWFVPARSDEHTRRWHHFPVVPDRAARVRAFLAAYGDLPGQHTDSWLEAGDLDVELHEAQWVRAHRQLLE